MSENENKRKKKTRRTLTNKQRRIMRCLAEGIRDENGIKIGWKDINGLLNTLDYETTRASIHFSLRPLIAYGLVERLPRELRNGRWVTPLALTDYALDYFERLIAAESSRNGVGVLELATEDEIIFYDFEPQDIDFSEEISK